METCEAKRTLDQQLAEDKERIKLGSLESQLKLADLASKDREKLLMQALEDARAANQREWWDSPNVFVPAGIVLGMGMTVGAVLLVGQLRPIIPTN